MEEEKTLVIPLGGSTADGERVQPGAATNDDAPKQKSGKAQPQEKGGAIQTSAKSGTLDSGDGSSQPDGPKKPNVLLRILRGLGALIIFLIVVAVIGAGVLLFLGTRDEKAFLGL